MFRPVCYYINNILTTLMILSSSQGIIALIIIGRTFFFFFKWSKQQTLTTGLSSNFTSLCSKIIAFHSDFFGHFCQRCMNKDHRKRMKRRSLDAQRGTAGAFTSVLSSFLLNCKESRGGKSRFHMETFILINAGCSHEGMELSVKVKAPYDSDEWASRVENK